MESSGGIGKDSRHLSSSEDEGAARDYGTASQQNEGDRKIAVLPSIPQNQSPGQLKPTLQSSDVGVAESIAEAGAATGPEMLSASETSAARTVLEPTLQLDEVSRKDLGSIDLPAYVKKKATTISFPEKVSRIDSSEHWVLVVDFSLTAGQE